MTANSEQPTATDQVCTMCNGTKEAMAFGLVYAPGHSGPFARMLPCPDCDGTGSISAERVANRIEGAKFRAARLAARLGLRQAAELMGEYASYISSVESGRLPLRQEHWDKLNAVIDSRRC